MSQTMNRKEFLTRCGLGSCVCVFGLSSLFADETKPAAPAKPAAPPEPTAEEPKRPRAEERIEFAEKWVGRFMGVLDVTLDAGTRRKVMMANGKACLLAYLKEIGRTVQPVTLEEYAAQVKARVKDGSTRVEGNVITMQFSTAAETGLPAEESACLCPLVETKPAGLSGSYCDCSLGYVQAMHELKLGRPVEVELTESVLRGGKRCKFKVTVL